MYSGYFYLKYGFQYKIVPDILQSIIFAGLTTDEAPLTILFLVTLKEKIVDNLSISKTSKLKMFNTKIMMKLLQVYTWIGPDRGKNNSKKVTNHEVRLIMLYNTTLRKLKLPNYVNSKYS